VWNTILKLIIEKSIPLTEIDTKLAQKLVDSGYAQIKENKLTPTEACLEALAEERFYGKRGLLLLSPRGAYFTPKLFGAHLLRDYFIVVKGVVEGELPFAEKPPELLVLEAEESYSKRNYGLAKAKLREAVAKTRDKEFLEKVEKIEATSELKKIIDEVKRRLGLREE